MTTLHTLDQKLLDQRLTGGLAPALSMRARYNTPVMAKFIASKFQVGEPISSRNSHVKAAEYWDADMQSYMYLQDFVNTVPSWQEQFRKVVMQANDRYGKGLDHEIEEVLEMAPEREERFMEIMDRDDADGAANYWLGMLQISPDRNPATYLMMRVGRRIGEHVVMCLKGYFRAPRPSQLCPAILPMIDPPGTPSLPAGHAVQAYLMSYLLAYSLPNLPQQTTPNNLDAATGPLFDLAYRVSQNRVVAGLHYPIDITAGRAVGTACFDALQDVDSLWGDRESEAGELRRKPETAHLTRDTSLEARSLRARVREEFPQYK